MSAPRAPLRERRRPKGLRRAERWLVGVVMTALAFVIERAVLRSIKKGNTEPRPREPSATTLTGSRAEISPE